MLDDLSQGNQDGQGVEDASEENAVAEAFKREIEQAAPNAAAVTTSAIEEVVPSSDIAAGGG